MSADETTMTDAATAAGAAPAAGPTTPGYDAALKATTPVRTLIGLVVASLAGVIVVAVHTALVGETEDVSSGDRVTTWVVLAIVIAASVIVTAGLGRRTTQPVIDWLKSDRQPSDEVRLLGLSLPVRLTIVVVGFWVLAAVIVFVVNSVLAVGVVLGGITAAAVAFIAMARLLHPIFQAATTGGVPRRARIGLGVYLTLTWLLVAVVPLLLITVPLQDMTDSELGDNKGTVLLIAIVWVLVGLAVTMFVVRSIGRPVRAVRDGLGRLGAGDLTDIKVDEGGDLGMLEADFNYTAATMRERKYLEGLFGRYVSFEAARDAIARNIPLTGEVREASVLYAELIASSSFTDQMQPHEVIGVLSEFFSAVYTSVSAEGGWITMFDGDSATCVFGPPDDRPEHSSNALNAARRLRQALDEVQARHPMVDAGVGVASGWVVAGTVGNETLFEYRVIGDPIIEAIGLCEVAKEHPGRVVASGWSTAHATDQAIDWAPVGEVHVRGRSVPTRTFAPVVR